MKVPEKFARTTKRALYYARSALLDSVPYALFERRLAALRPQIEEIVDGDGEITDRVNYYNHMQPAEMPLQARPIAQIERAKSYYYYDLKLQAKHFGPSRAVNYVFGDVTTVPPEPALVKSRPIAGDNDNSILFKLNKLRHFNLHMRSDAKRFRDKKPIAVWRGDVNSELRRALVSSHGGHPSCDVGFVSKGGDGSGLQLFMTIAEQLDHRFVISVEGFDVATNLKWIMASNSLCLMPRPRYETWYMEGRLQPGIHYVEVRDDFADLADKIAYFNDNVAEAEEIVANANARLWSFFDPKTEELCQLAVLYKYFRMTGQI